MDETPTSEVNAAPQTAETPELEAEKKLVDKIIKEIKADKKHFSKPFKRIRDNMELAFRGSIKSWDEADKYVVPLVQRHINQSVASLYAKNPVMKVTRRPRLDHTAWDGTQEQFELAAQDVMMATQAGMEPKPESMAILEDIERAKGERRVIDNVCRTLELVMKYTLDENSFKRPAKQWVRRAKTTGVGWCRIGYQRQMERRPETQGQINDITTQLGKIDQLRAKQTDPEAPQDDAQEADAEKLRLSLGALEQEPDVIAREGLVYSWPRSTAVIPDRETLELRGLTGCGHMTEEFCYSLDQVQDLFKVNLKAEGWGFTRYEASKATGELKEQKTGRSGDGKDDEPEKCAVWQYFERSTGLMYTVCDGCPRFLEKPAKPNVRLERFFVHFALTFNEVEHEAELYPPSDVSLIKHMQLESNRAREDLRQHRYANRPAWLTAKGRLEDEDKKNLKDYAAHAIVFLNALATGEKAVDLLARMPTAPIDENAYTVQPFTDDLLRAVGSQEANLGPTSGATATESSIAETSRESATASNVDDLDQTLEDIARATAQTLLTMMRVETARKIAGPGAVWPEASAQEVQEEIMATIEAGSSGRPNRAQEAATFERLLPLLIQIPGIKPEALAKEAIRRLDDKLDLDEVLEEGLPSIVSMNQQTQPGTGDPATDPNQQGQEGGDNSQQQPGKAQGPQAAFPTPVGPANTSNASGRKVA